MSDYHVTETQLKAIRDRLVFTVGSEVATRIFEEHPRMLTTDHIVATGGGCEAYIVEFPHGDERIIVVWTSEDGMALPEGTEHEEFLCGVYLNEISEDALAINNGDIHKAAPF